MNFFKSVAKDFKEAVEDSVEDAVEEFTGCVDNQDEKRGANEPQGGESAFNERTFEEKAETAIPGMVRQFSGCQDDQTSADVGNVASFKLPEDSGPGGAGGAMTCSLIATLRNAGGDKELTWVEILESMRGILGEKGYSQIPQLSSSRKLDVQHEKFSIMNKEPTGKRRALLVGINYIGQQGELHGCHNDVEMMKTYLESQGFQEDEMMVLLDDGQHKSPTGKNILAGFDWLTDTAQPGDSLVFHYSGHGAHMKDANNDEADGRDETIIPVDYQDSGMIADDLLFKELVMPLPHGCQLTAIMDCCHSGTVLDLPFLCKATEDMSSASMQENPGFSFQKLFKIAQKLYQMKQSGASQMDLAKTAAKEVMPLFAGKNKLSGGLANLSALGLGGGGGSGFPF